MLYICFTSNSYVYPKPATHTVLENWFWGRWLSFWKGLFSGSILVLVRGIRYSSLDTPIRPPGHQHTQAPSAPLLMPSDSADFSKSSSKRSTSAKDSSRCAFVGEEKYRSYKGWWWFVALPAFFSWSMLTKTQDISKIYAFRLQLELYIERWSSEASDELGMLRNFK